MPESPEAARGEDAHESTPGMYLLVGIYSALFFLGYLYYFWDVAVRWGVN